MFLHREKSFLNPWYNERERNRIFRVRIRGDLEIMVSR